MFDAAVFYDDPRRWRTIFGRRSVNAFGNCAVLLAFHTKRWPSGRTCTGRT
jgi:hypothetical protein